MTRVLVLAGLALVALGLLWPLLQKIGLGRLPGDVTLRGERWSVHVPVVTCLLLSLAATALFALLRRIRW